jgi:energy-coupling factor transporter transmembrane protein EcfT
MIRSSKLKHFGKRLFFILLGYALASVASGIVASLAEFGLSLIVTVDFVTKLSNFMGLCAMVTMLIALYAALPAAIVVLIGEVCVVRRKLYYAIAGCGIGAALPILVNMNALIPVGLLFGPVAGLIYWYVAGRKASLQPPSEA